MAHTITIDEIRKFEPCHSGLRTLLNALRKDTNYASYNETTPIDYNFIIKHCTFNDAIWGLRCNSRGVEIAAKFAKLCADHVKCIKNSYATAAAAAAATAATAVAEAVAAAAVDAAIDAVAAVVDAVAVDDAAVAAAYNDESEWQKQQLIQLCNEQEQE